MPARLRLLISDGDEFLDRKVLEVTIDRRVGRDVGFGGHLPLLGQSAHHVRGVDLALLGLISPVLQAAPALDRSAENAAQQGAANGGLAQISIWMRATWAESAPNFLTKARCSG